MMALLPEVIRKRFDPAGRYGLRLTLFALALLIFAIPFGYLLNQVVRQGSFMKVDTSAANHLHGWVRNYDGLVAFLRVVTFLGTPLWFYIAVGGICMWLWLRHRRRLVVFLLTTTLGGGAVDTAVKVLVNRPRPSLEDPISTAFGKSFPSGHAMISLLTYGAVVLVFLPVISRRRRFLLITGAAILVLLIGFSRLALGVHYISDVLGGYALGAAWLLASTAAFSIWREERGAKPVKPIAGVEPEAASDLKP
jgi:membrane-associated phospholipid phosphatase